MKVHLGGTAVQIRGIEEGERLLDRVLVRRTFAVVVVKT